MTPTELAAATERALPEMIEDLRTLVELETPSNDKRLLDAGLAAISDWIDERLGAPDTTERHDCGEYGDVLAVTYRGTAPGTVLLLCHYDTVWPAGTLGEWPFEVVDGRACGPGVFDMKTGIVQAVWTVRLLRELGLPHPSARLLLTGDEEIGSPVSRRHIERLSEDVLATLVFEASLDGAVKTSRKGVGLFDVTAHGVESHAGLDPFAGASAIHALAEVIPHITALGSAERGTTVNVGLISGGTGRNVVAARASCGIDVRVAEPAEMARIDAALRALTPSDPRVRLTVTGEWNRPPMVPDDASRRLYKQARAVAAEQGWALEETAVGGASDGNFVAGLGRPVLDGLGALGSGAHARHEHTVLAPVPARTALTVGLMRALAVADPETA
ncbi:M20 family metallopeptidase [Streptomyces coffeae]|uniref:M20 family metallopeptidase n=1 Tax=Streptomyces coffeae TaxID=621382 RepID=A0ABS1N6B8_9ACTN|nr:M20 family metallopeptidase [Streptomyces coffeae]MBL1095599.1 M20 family metallopeptidase [Streptomyces coffeae]